MSATLDQISSLINAQRFPEALSALSAALSDDPKNWNLHYLMGFAYRCIGDYASAIAAYSDAAQLAPHQAPIVVNLGVAYQLAGDYLPAIASPVHPQVDGDFAGLPCGGLAKPGSCNANY